jgi:hypothetical protein
VLKQLGVAPDFTADPALDFTHRSTPDAEIYFVRNRTAAPVRTSVTLRDGRGSPQFWDPMTGAIRPLAGARRTTAGSSVPLSLDAHGAGFIVVRDGSPPPSTAPQTPPRAATPPAPIELDADWTIDFTTPLGEAPQKVTFARVAPWTQQGAPELRYFAGSGKYRRTVVLPAGWRQAAGRVELELGHLWSIGEVWVNGTALGVVWAAPFSVDCTAALHDGENEIVVEVVGTWHNRLVGEARGALPKLARTNITVSQRKQWKDLEPIEAGLFGPVRLVPTTAP